jgi:DNA-directed RNA polymerase specialized sigma subunit
MKKPYCDFCGSSDLIKVENKGKTGPKFYYICRKQTEDKIRIGIYELQINHEEERKLFESNIRFIASIAKKFAFNKLSLTETVNRFNEVEQQLIRNLGRVPLSEEIAVEVDETIDKIEQIIKSFRKYTYLKGTDGKDSEDSILEDKISNSKAITPSCSNYIQILLKNVNSIIRNLPLREKKIFDTRFGLINGIPHTLEETGKEFNVTRERIRQLILESYKQIVSNVDIHVLLKWEKYFIKENQEEEKIRRKIREKMKSVEDYKNYYSIVYYARSIGEKTNNLKKYFPEIAERIKINSTKVMEKDGFKCSSCGISQDFNLKKYKIDLHITHIKGNRQYNSKDYKTYCHMCDTDYSLDYKEYKRFLKVRIDTKVGNTNYKDYYSLFEYLELIGEQKKNLKRYARNVYSAINRNQIKVLEKDKFACVYCGVSLYNNRNAHVLHKKESKNNKLIDYEAVCSNCNYKLHFSNAEMSKNSENEKFDQALFDRLKELRTEIYKEKEVPAYVIFSNSTLEDIARYRPVNKEDFISIKGVGEKKYLLYGESFIDCIHEYIKTNKIAPKEVPNNKKYYTLDN